MISKEYANYKKAGKFFAVDVPHEDRSEKARLISL
jgi:hypothetical protein